MISVNWFKFSFIILFFVYSNILFTQTTSSSNGNYSNNNSWIGNAPNSQTTDILILDDLILDISIVIKKDFEVQGSLVGTTGQTITVKNSGNLIIGALDIDQELSIEGNGQLTIKAGDTVYVDNLSLSGSAVVVIESNAVVYIANDFEVRNTVVLTIQSGAEVYVGNNFELSNSTVPVIDGDVFVTNEFSTKNTVTITGNGSITAGSQSQISNSSSVFGSTSACSTCVYSNGCTYNSVTNIWTGLIDNDWFNTLNWIGGVPTEESQVSIPATTNAVIAGIGAKCFNLVIESGGSLEVADGDTLSVHGDIIFIGNFVSNKSVLNFVGNCWSSQIFSNDTIGIYSIVVDNTSNVAINSGYYQLSGALTLRNGSFFTNDSLVLISDAVRTARIDEITGGGSVVGEIEMQRYIDAGETYWRFFSSAVQGATVADYQGDFITSGYVGSDFPSFPFTSVFTYDEGVGYTAVSNANQVINPGEGFMVWSGDTITGTDPFVVDYRGVPNQGNISMPVDLTNNDGWNLVGNPYASTIDWDSPNWTKTNMANSVYILNPDTEQYATYINGASANGGSRFIASQQAFWVGAIGNNPVLTASEGVKSPVDQAFFKSGSAISSGLHIVLSGNNMTDEAVLRHVEGATDGYDSEYDATKKFASWIDFPHVSILNAANVDYTVHSFDKSFQEWTLPIRTIVFQNGAYDIVFTDINELNVPCIQLEDTYDGQMYPIEDGIPLTFNMSDTTYAPRFILHIGKTYETVIEDALCNGDLGSAMISTDSVENGSYQLSSATYNTTGTFAGGIEINNLPAGSFTLTVNGLNNICQTNQFDIVIEEPSELITQSIINPETAGQDGSIAVQAIGGTPIYTYLWSTGSTDSVLTGISAGNYGIVITDANGCSISKSFDLISVLGVEDFRMETKYVYFTAENRVKITGAVEQIYTLIDIAGQTIAVFEMGSGLQEANILLPSTIAPGTYFLTGNNTVFKIVK